MRPFFGVLHANFKRGDAKAVAFALRKPQSTVSLWQVSPLPDAMGKWSPVDFYVRLIEAVRNNGNIEGADTIHLAVCEALGFVAYKKSEGYTDDADFAALLNEFSDVVNERAKAESPSSPGGIIRTPNERRMIAKRALELAAAALKYGDDQLALADAEERTPIRRRA